MAGKERLIDQDPDAEAENAGSDDSKSTLFLIIKISLALGVISTLITGLILTNMRLATLEEKIVEFKDQVASFQKQHETVTENVRLLTKGHLQLKASVGTLDLGAAKGDLSTALSILDTQSDAFNKQLAVTRNGLMSLSRMVKGSRVWQEDYKGQYQGLFEENRQIKDAIKGLRGIQDTPHEEVKYLEMDF